MKSFIIFSLILCSALLSGLPNQPVKAQEYGVSILMDQVFYTWTDKAYITIVAPDHNKWSNVQEYLGKDPDGYVTISSSLGKLEGYELLETGKDTGIFTGEITLTGFPLDVNGDGSSDTWGGTYGNGPNHGNLAVSNDDEIKATINHFGKSYSSYAMVIWNIGEVQWLGASYPMNSEGEAMVVDPDINLDPEIIDMVSVRVWSDSDTQGTELLLIETNKATGIFEGSVFLSNEESSDSTLKVKNGDKISAEYEDRTLPGPFYKTSDALQITASSKIGNVAPSPSPSNNSPSTDSAPIDPEIVNQWMEEGRSLYQSGKYEEAIPFFDKVIETPFQLSVFKNQMSAPAYKAYSLFGLEKYDESNKFLDEYLHFEKNDYFAFNMKGLILANLGDFEKALQYFERSSSINPDNLTSLHNQGWALSNLGRYAEAIEFFDKVLAIDPNLEVTKQERQIAIEKLNPENSNKSTSENGISNQKYYDEKTSAPIVEPTKELTVSKPAQFVDPAKEPIYYIDRYYNEPEYKEWFEKNYPDYTIEEAVGFSSTDPAPWYQRGLELFNAGNYELSVRYFDKALLIDPTHDLSKDKKQLAEQKSDEFRAFADPKDVLPESNTQWDVIAIFVTIGIALIAIILVLKRKFRRSTRKGLDSKPKNSEYFSSNTLDDFVTQEESKPKPTREVYCKDTNNKTLIRKIEKENEILITHICDEHKDHPALQGEEITSEEIEVLANKSLDPVHETIQESQVLFEKIQKKGLKQLIIGIIAMAIPAIIFIVSSNSTDGYVAFYGLFLVGMYIIAKGLVNLKQGKNSKNRKKTQLVQSKLD